MLDVGQGECFVLDFPDGTFAVIDAGPVSARELVKGAVAKRIADGRRFRWAAATQWDADHIGGFPSLLRAHTPEEFVSPALDLGQMEMLLSAVDPGSPSRRAVVSLQNTIRALSMEQTPAWARMEVPDCGTAVHGWFLSPDKNVKDELHDAIKENRVSASRFRALGNRTSLVILLSAYGRSVFLPGEIEADQYETARVQFDRRRRPVPTALQSDIVKLSHHGAERSNPIEFFQYFCANGAIGLTSAGGRYGHPSPSAIRDLGRVANGRHLCTGLGQPCNEIIGGRQPNDGDFGWAREITWQSVPSPQRKCHGNVTLRINTDGRIDVMTETSPHLCPFQLSAIAPRASKSNKSGKVARASKVSKP